MLPQMAESSPNGNISSQRAMAIVVGAIEMVNRELEYDSLREVEEDTPVFGGPDGIDSLSLVMLVVELESRIEEEFGQRVVLADAAAMSATRSPYRTAGSLVDFILERLNGVIG